MRMGNEKANVGSGIHQSSSLGRGRVAGYAALSCYYKHMTRLCQAQIEATLKNPHLGQFDARGPQGVQAASVRFASPRAGNSPPREAE
jgi:hypothetical protein